jgi:hypothetical protein
VSLTAPAQRSDDALLRGRAAIKSKEAFQAGESGVALRLPPQSMMLTEVSHQTVLDSF